MSEGWHAGSDGPLPEPSRPHFVALRIPARPRNASRDSAQVVLSERNLMVCTNSWPGGRDRVGDPPDRFFYSYSRSTMAATPPTSASAAGAVTAAGYPKVVRYADTRAAPPRRAGLTEEIVMRCLWVLPIAMALSAVDCGGGSQPPASASSRSPQPNSSRAQVDPLAGSHAVAFTTSDGVNIEGRVFGTGAVAVVLAHGDLTQGQASWFQFAPSLAQRGYLVLTFNFRGYCPSGSGGCSGGAKEGPKTWLDLSAGIDYLHQERVTKVFLVGASLGAHTIMWAAAQPGIETAGLVVISGAEPAAAKYSPGYDITPTILQRIHAPKLFIAGTRDPLGVADSAQQLYNDSAEPKQIELVDSVRHGADLLTQSGADPQVVGRVRQLLFDFVAR